MKLIMRGRWLCTSGDFYGELALEVPDNIHMPDRKLPTSPYDHFDEAGDWVEGKMVWLARAMEFYLGKDGGYFTITIEELVAPMGEQTIQTEIRCE